MRSTFFCAQRVHGGRDREVGLARAGRPDREHDVVRLERLQVAHLVRRARVQRLALEHVGRPSGAARAAVARARPSPWPWPSPLPAGACPFDGGASARATSVSSTRRPRSARPTSSLSARAASSTGVSSPATESVESRSVMRTGTVCSIRRRFASFCPSRCERIDVLDRDFSHEDPSHVRPGAPAPGGEPAGGRFPVAGGHAPTKAKGPPRGGTHPDPGADVRGVARPDLA